MRYKTISAAFIAACILQPAIAYAQEAEDVLVIRRTMSLPVLDVADDSDEQENGDDAENLVYSWNQSSWTAWADACSLTTTRTRSVTCEDQSGNVASDGLCTGARPNESETGENFSGCNAEWAIGEWSDWSTTCGNAERSRSVRCVSFEIDDAGYSIPEEHCIQVENEPQENEASFIRTTCDPIYNGSFDQGLDGWLTRRSIANEDGALMEGMSHPNTAYIIQEVPVQSGVTYDFNINYSGNTTGCSESRAVPIALYRRPNGATQPVEGAFFSIPFQFCDFTTSSKSASFTADYTGVASLVIWVEATAGKTHSAVIHDVSLLPR